MERYVTVAGTSQDSNCKELEEKKMLVQNINVLLHPRNSLDVTPSNSPFLKVFTFSGLETLH